MDADGEAVRLRRFEQRPVFGVAERLACRNRDQHGDEPWIGGLTLDLPRGRQTVLDRYGDRGAEPLVVGEPVLLGRIVECSEQCGADLALLREHCDLERSQDRMRDAKAIEQLLTHQLQISTGGPTSGNASWR